MQFKVSTVNYSRNIICFESETFDGLLYAVVVANPLDPNAFSESSGFASLLTESVEGLSTGYTVSEFPGHLADSLEHVITLRAKLYPALFHVGYVGIGISDRDVSVSTAGN